MPKPACAIWPWGTSTKEQFIQALTDIRDVGYLYYESIKNTIDIFKDDINEFKELNEKHNVTPASFYFHLMGNEENDILDLERKLPFLQENGITRISLQAGGVVGRPANQEELDYTVAAFNRIGKICKPYNVLPCIHPHVNTVMMYENEIDYVMQRVNPDELFFGPDTAHLKGGLCDPVAVFEKYKDRIQFTHLKDIADFKVVAEGMDAGVEVYKNFLELGEGNLDFKAIFDVLKSVNYDGFLTTELDRTRFDNKTSAKMNLDFIKANY